MIPIMPKAGTPAFDDFMRRARNPQSIEASMLRKVMDDTTEQTQSQVRSMLYSMIELVPGQLFRDIGRFHDKFALKPTEDPGHQLPEDLLKFRIKFLMEELEEYMSAVGFEFDFHQGSGRSEVIQTGEFDAAKALDSLIDLVYVALGTAFMHRFPFNEGWDRVQAANMAKVRAVDGDDPLSTRKHKADVVKPPGWVPPVLDDLLDEACTICGGSGVVVAIGESDVVDDKCIPCNGIGRKRRG